MPSRSSPLVPVEEEVERGQGPLLVQETPDLVDVPDAVVPGDFDIQDSKSGGKEREGIRKALVHMEAKGSHVGTEEVYSKLSEPFHGQEGTQGLGQGD